MKTDVYVHADTDGMREEGEKLGFTGDALSMFAHTAYEVRLTVEVDPQTGDSVILGVDGKKVSDEPMAKPEPIRMENCRRCSTPHQIADMNPIEFNMEIPGSERSIAGIEYLCVACTPEFKKEFDAKTTKKIRDALNDLEDD